MRNLFFVLILLTILFPAIATATDTVDINNATLSQLDIIAGIGPAMAQRIIDARPFSSVDDLNRVKGIGVKTLQKIKDQGVACVGCATSVETTASQTNDQPATPAVTYPSGIIINELLPNPSGADETNEWVELYNSNNIEVDLTGWQIQDISGTPKTFTIPKDAKLMANGFLLFKRPDTKIMLNNDVDGINLLTPDKKIVDSVNYTKAPLGQSYSKVDSGWKWSLTPTPETKNIITVATTSTKGLSKIKNSVNNDLSTQGLADISLPAQAGQNLNTSQATNKNNPWFLFYIVLSTAIILATIILFIKNKKQHVRT